MIPATIHYCWFGHNEKPKSVKKCIKSWEKFLPDYEIIEWNEYNYNLGDAPPFVIEAYKNKKWAFVSDYVRFDVLYRFGGVYFDTDVEIIQPIEDIISNGPFMACEIDGKDDNETNECLDYYQTKIRVAAGLGMAAIPNMHIYNEILEVYRNSNYYEDNCSPLTVVRCVTDVLLKHKLQDISTIQRVEGITIYPTEFFCPINWRTREMKKTKNTRAIHWYDATWWDKGEKEKRMKYARLEKKKLNKAKVKGAIYRVGITFFGKQATYKITKFIRGLYNAKV